LRLGDIPAQLAFNEEDEENGKKLLRSMGIEPCIPFVCFNARDGAYLKKVYPKDTWSYHDYRNCSLKNYIPAAEYLSRLGMAVLRMGYIVEEELKTDDPKIIDYATAHRRDFGDIYLSAKCKFFIASEGGLSSVAWIFNVPIVYTNGAPPGGIAGWRKGDLFIPKRLWSVDKKRFLTFSEILSSGMDWFMSAKDYREACVELVENTPEEILAVVKEMCRRLDRSWVTSEDDEELQSRYRALFSSKNKCYGFPSRIGTDFLRQNSNLLNGAKVRNEADKVYI